MFQVYLQLIVEINEINSIYIVFRSITIHYELQLIKS